MRLAIPVHQGRVAPVFDCCRRMLIFLQNPEEHKLVEDQDWSVVSRLARPKRLQELMVELLICGGISCWMEDRICGQGILIIPWIAGGVDEVLAALRQGRISDPCYTMPGRGKCRRKDRFENMQELRRQARGPFQKGA
jgi:predicted Fe-Mo cluster-binding NifX family protein